jgi:hypothetical protein
MASDKALKKVSKTKLAEQTWNRYEYLRDHGFTEYLLLSDKCGRFWFGNQWDEETVAKLDRQRRPHVTMNFVLTTTDTMLGEQINNRNEVRYRPRYGKNADKTSDVLNKVFKHISQGNNLTWVRSDVFEDGLITGRGFYEVKLGFDDNMLGEVRVTRLNPKNVMIDADATEYDPDTWNDVGVTRWLTIDDVEILYGKNKADQLRSKVTSSYDGGLDLSDDLRDRVASAYELQGRVPDDDVEQAAYVRIFDRQYRMLTMRKFFVNLRHGDMRPVPDDWDEDRIAEYQASNPDIAIMQKLAKRIRWTTVACNIVLHDEWSPYEHFTIVPYFAHFRNGRSVGLVEQLIGVQELLNKSVSQELHIVNTTSNSGWKVKKGAMTNMTTEELSVRGAETGLVIEMSNSLDEIEKIQPNQVPTGIDRLSQKAEAMLKALGVSDYMRGEARADVSARALEANQNQGRTGMARILDNLIRTDVILARAILSIVQNYYVEERVMYIAGIDGKPDESFTVNEVGEDGSITNDLTLGEYLVTVDSAPAKESLEDSQFQQALAMRENNIPIPDSVLIQNSRLLDKMDIIKSMEEAANSPEAQRRGQLELDMLEAEVLAKRGEYDRLQADAANKSAQAEQKQVAALKEAQDADEMTPDQARTIIEKQRLEAAERTEERKFALEERKLALEERKLEVEREKIRLDAVTERVKARIAEKTKQTGESANVKK